MLVGTPWPGPLRRTASAYRLESALPRGDSSSTLHGSLVLEEEQPVVLEQRGPVGGQALRRRRLRGSPVPHASP